MTQQPGPTPAHRGDPVPPPTQPVAPQPPVGADRTAAVAGPREPTPDEQRAARSSDRHDRHDAHDRHDRHDRHEDREVVDPARDKFGGVNLGACFFGWIVAVGVTILVAGIVTAVVTAVGSQTGVTQSEAERQSGTIGLVTAIVLLVVLALGYYAGGYVAGRMSRFDGGRQGIAVWVLGLVVTLVAIGVGAIFGNEYNVLDRVDLPRVYLSDSQIGWGAVVTALAVLVATLVAAWLGGVVGRRYHHRVDRVTGKAWEEAAGRR